MKIKDIDRGCIAMVICTIFSLVFPMAARWIMLGVCLFLLYSAYVAK